MNKPLIRCYRSHGQLWWECCDSEICAWGRTPVDAWDNWYNRSVPF